MSGLEDSHTSWTKSGIMNATFLMKGKKKIKIELLKLMGMKETHKMKLKVLLLFVLLPKDY
jgi:hypothetical protein